MKFTVCNLYAKRSIKLMDAQVHDAQVTTTTVRTRLQTA
jgi:hypothetical protein